MLSGGVNHNHTIRNAASECHASVYENINIRLDEISTINLFAFNGVITDYLPLAAAPAFIALEHPGGHTFTIRTACECFSPYHDFGEGRGWKDKPSSKYTILSLALISQLELCFQLLVLWPQRLLWISQLFLALARCFVRSNRT
jgi:hypothetical protein